jgi:hypothetical protein
VGPLAFLIFSRGIRVERNQDRAKILTMNITDRVGDRLRQLREGFFLDMGGEDRTVFLAGTGRSGTTWLQELINHDNSFRIMFEPFNSRKVPLLREWNFRQYLRAENCDDKFLVPARKILRGSVRNRWMDAFNAKWVARKRLIKDIRANLFLQWMVTQFPHVPVILLLRHPCAVASSKLKLGWNTQLECFLDQDDLMEDFLEPFRDEMQAASEPFDKHIFLWCVENYVPLRQFSDGQVLVVFYEELCNMPEETLERLVAFAGTHIAPGAERLHAMPSRLSRKDSAVVKGTDRIRSWRQDISGPQLRRAAEILRLFELDRIYGEDDLPHVKGDEVLKMFQQKPTPTD